ncbi:unnamed protein product [Pelagomonas calceolata]|uniref:Uncharacterized protein n=2 Tax=Pelagomonas calceolata TaxID=35677 RepID=A0A8J2SNU1_9STRA|nr:unnamed protein product [Pelagomonas calceolata]
MRRAAYERALGTAASSIDNALPRASPGRRRRRNWRSSMAEQRAAALAAQAAAPEPQGCFSAWKLGVGPYNAALVVFGVFVVQFWLNGSWAQSAVLAAATYALSEGKLLEPLRFAWVGFTLSVILGIYYKFKPFCYWLYTDVVVKPVRDGFSEMDKDPQLEAAVVVSLCLVCLLSVSFARDGPISKNLADVLGRLVTFEAAAPQRNEPNIYINGVRGLCLWLSNYWRSQNMRGRLRWVLVGGVQGAGAE